MFADDSTSSLLLVTVPVNELPDLRDGLVFRKLLHNPDSPSKLGGHLCIVPLAVVATGVCVEKEADNIPAVIFKDAYSLSKPQRQRVSSISSWLHEVEASQTILAISV